MIYFSWFAYDFAYDGVAFSKSYVHMVSYRFSFCFTIPYGMMWTHFSYHIYGEYGNSENEESKDLPDLKKL